MLATLAAHARRLGLEVETVVTGAERLPFADASFDLVFGHAVLHHIPDPAAAFAEFRRVLRPGGGIAFCGEPSRYGDLLASLPKRAGVAAAPRWPRGLGARGRAEGGAAPEGGQGPGWEADAPPFPPADWPPRPARPDSRSAASAARNCWPTCTAGC